MFPPALLSGNRRWALFFAATSGSCGAGQSERPVKEDESAPACQGERPSGALCLSTVSGRVVDERGDPTPDLDVTVCGPVCFLGTTTDSGAFSIEVNRFVFVSEYSVQPHGSPTASTFYHQLPDVFEDGDVHMGTLPIVDLPSNGDLLTTKLDLQGGLAPAQTVTSENVTLLLGEGTELRLSVRDALAGDEGRRFRARELEPEQTRAFAPELPGARVFALGPFEADITGQQERQAEVSLRIENRHDWPAEAEVEVLALGTYLDPQWLSPSMFEFVGIALVSADGETIELPSEAEGPGLRHLTWIALRL